MKIYSCCIPTENELKREIDNLATESEMCPFCRKESKFLESEKVSTFISRVLDCLVPSKTGNLDLRSFFYKYVRIFRDDDASNRIEYYLQNTKYDLKEKYDYNDEIKQVLVDWDKFKNEVKTIRRFTIFDRYLDENGWDALLTNNDLIYDLDSSVLLYRARIHDKLVNEAYAQKDILPQFPNYFEGRAHPIGIKCIYLSKERDTTLYETRVSKLDNVTIAEFRLKNKKRIFDLASSIGCFLNLSSSENERDISTILKRNLLLNKISEELSKPIHRHDSPIEYIPTQIICEYISYLNNVDGIQYSSSMNGKGTNIVLFNFSDIEMEMQNAALFNVKDVTIEYEEKNKTPTQEFQIMKM